MGLFGDDSTPDFKVPDSATDMNTAKFAETSLNRQDHGVQEAYARSRDQMDSARGLMPTAQNYQRQDATMGRQTNQAQLNAIQTKGENLFSRNVQQMKMQSELNEYSSRSAKLAQDFQLSSKQNQIFETIKQGRLAAERARIAARNAVLGNVFAAVGAVVGTIAGGNTVAGAAVGAGVGKAVAGSTDSGASTQDVLNNFNNSPGGPRSQRNEQGNGMGNFNDRLLNKYGVGD